MPKVSVVILTKNRRGQLQQAIGSVLNQTFKDYEIIVVNDGSTDGTENVLLGYRDIKTVRHETSVGITQSRQEALEASGGEYVAFLDDDDEWVDENKLQKQVKFFEGNSDHVLVGGGIVSESVSKNHESKMRPETDSRIRSWMLVKNPFFTSTVIFKRQAAVAAGGFKKDGTDVAEDYDLWLRMGLLGKMYNFQEVFTLYRKPSYNKAKFNKFLAKQLKLIKDNKNNYPYFWLAFLFLKIRLFLSF